MRIPENENGFSPSERLFLLYRHLLEHTNSEKAATPAETFNLQWEYDQKQKGYRVNNPAFEPREIRLLIDSAQASHFHTQTKAEALVKKIKILTENPNHRISALLGRKKAPTSNEIGAFGARGGT